MSYQPKLNLYIGNTFVCGMQVPCFAVTTTRKKAAELFECSVKYINSFFQIFEITTLSKDSKYQLAIKCPDRIFISNSLESDCFRLFLDDEKFKTSFNLISNYEDKKKFYQNAKENNAQYLKVRLLDQIALENNILNDIFLYIGESSSEEEVCSFYHMPFKDKLISDHITHLAVQTNHSLEYIFDNMVDIYAEVVKPYTVRQALDFVGI